MPIKQSQSWELDVAPTTMLDSGMYSEEDFVELVLDDADAHGAIVSDLEEEFQEMLSEGETGYLQRFITDIIDRLEGVGKQVFYDGNIFAIYGTKIN